MSFQIELHSLIIWVRSLGLFQDYEIFEDMLHGITLRRFFLKVLQFVDISVGCVTVGYDIPENIGSFRGPDSVFEWDLKTSKYSV